MLRLTRPGMWWRGGHARWLAPSALPTLSPFEIAILLQLRRATLAPIPHAGDSMNDDHTFVLSLLSAPTAEPVTLAQAKSFLRIEHSGDDDAISRAITAARLYAEQYLHCALLPQSWQLKIANPGQCSIALPVGPAQNITSVTASNLQGSSATVAASNYRLSVDGRKAIFDPLPGTDILTITYSAGIAATVADVPALIAQGILHHVAAMMETRDGAAALPVQAVNCYQPFRRISL